MGFNGFGGLTVELWQETQSEILRRSSVNEGAVEADARGSIRGFSLKHKISMNLSHNVSTGGRKYQYILSL